MDVKRSHGNEKVQKKNRPSLTSQCASKETLLSTNQTGSAFQPCRLPVLHPQRLWPAAGQREGSWQGSRCPWPRTCRPRHISPCSPSARAHRTLEGPLGPNKGGLYAALPHQKTPTRGTCVSDCNYQPSDLLLRW